MSNEINQKDVEIHIHEHLSPIREKVTRLEAVVEFHEKELKEVKDAVCRLDRKVDQHHGELLTKMDNYHKDIINTFHEHDLQDRDKDEEILQKVHDNETKITSMRWWIIGVGIGITILTTALELFDIVGLFKTAAGG